jgi:hypothetical protein
MFEWHNQDLNLFRQEDAMERLGWHCDKEEEKSAGGLTMVKDLKNFLETKINITILESGICDIEYFLCSTYVADFLSRAKTFFESTWYPTDQQLKIAEGKGGPRLWEDGGKKCFVIAVFFPEIHPKTGRSAKYYTEMSANFFYSFYTSSGLEIGNHMAELCQEMVGLTKEALA